VTPGQAKWVIQKLISERRLSPGEVTRYVNDMQREIGNLERQLQSLREAHGGGSSYSSSSSSSSSSSAPTGARRGRKPGSKNKVPGAAAAIASAPAGDQPVRKRRGRPPRSASVQPAFNPGNVASAQPSVSTGAAGGGAKVRRRRQRSAITPEQLASRQLQGRYLALIRQIPESRRAQYAKIAKDNGRESAIKAMQDVVKR